MNSLLKQERTNRHWSRSKVEELTGIPQRSLENWEELGVFPRKENIKLLCQLYDKSPEELGFGESYDIMGSTKSVETQQEGNPMSDLIRRHLFSNLGSRLFSLVDTWPKRDYRYEELQAEINKAIFDHHVLAKQDSIAETSRREALKSMALVPVQLVGGTAIIQASGRKTTDTVALLKYYAAGITVCWYLRRGKDLAFVSDLMSTYISILQPLVYSHSEIYRKASAGLLVQCFILKESVTRNIENSDHLRYIEQALQNGIIAEDPQAQALAYRQRSISHYRQEDYRQAIIDAEHAESLIDSQTNTSIQTQIYAGLAECLAADGKMDQALHWLNKAFQVFDPTQPIPVHVLFSSAIFSHNSGNVYRYGGQWGAAADCYNESLVSHDTSALGTMQVSIRRAQVEACRDDQPRDMELTTRLWTQGMNDAKELKSHHYIKEARKAYSLLVAAWPTEDAVKKLRKYL